MADSINSNFNSFMLPNLFENKNSSSIPEVSNMSVADISVKDIFNKAETLAKNDFTSISSYLGGLISPMSLFTTLPFDPIFNFSSEKFDLNIDKASIGRNTSPSLETIKDGIAVIQLGDKGTSVGILQDKLTKLGYKVTRTNTFDISTENALKKFQKDHNVEPTGQLGKTTLESMNKAESVPVSSSYSAKLLAKAAEKVARARGTFGMCYAGVATAMDRVFGGIVYGNSAYMAAPQLASNKKFKEVKIKSSELPKLPAGAVVVWGKTKDSPHGHISVALGNGKEASDHITNQLTNLRGYTNCRVFLPA
ncbi:MAG: peptidoglycan-binding domain-containing protein [Cyanobacteriota bacterium]